MNLMDRDDDIVVDYPGSGLRYASFPRTAVRTVEYNAEELLR